MGKDISSFLGQVARARYVVSVNEVLESLAGLIREFPVAGQDSAERAALLEASKLIYNAHGGTGREEAF